MRWGWEAIKRDASLSSTLDFDRARPFQGRLHYKVLRLSLSGFGCHQSHWILRDVALEISLACVPKNFEFTESLGKVKGFFVTTAIQSSEVIPLILG